MRIQFPAVFLTVVLQLQAQRVITTIAGTDAQFPPGRIPALEAPLGEVFGITAGADGSTYFCDRQNHLVVRLFPDGTLVPVAGNGLRGFTGEGGPATSASLSSPTSVAVAPDGTLFIADRGNKRIRVVDTSGNIRTLAGVSIGLSLVPGFTVLAIDRAGQLLVSDSAGAIQRVDSAGRATTFATGFSFAAQIAVSGNDVLVAELRGQRILRVAPDGSKTTVAGSGVQGFSGDGGPATSAKLNNPSGVSVDNQGRIWIADLGNHRVRRVESDGTIVTVAGTGDLTVQRSEGPGATTGLPYPTTLAVAGDSVFVTGVASLGVRRISSDGRIFRAAGNSRFSSTGDGGPAVSAAFQETTSLTVTANGIYFPERMGNRIRHITPAGIIETVAGTGETGYAGDGGPAVSALLAGPANIGSDAAGNVYFPDSSNGAIRKIDTDGRISTVLRDDRLIVKILVELDNALSSNRGIVYYPFTVDPAGNCYVVLGGTLSQITPALAVVPIAAVPNNLFSLAWDPTGTGSIVGGGSGNLIRVSLSGTVTPITTTVATGTVTCLFVDRTGSLLICGTRNQIGQVFPNGSIGLVAGNGRFTADGPVVFMIGLNGTALIFTDPRTLANDGDGGLAPNAAIIADGLAIDSRTNVYMIGGGRLRVLPVDSQSAAAAPQQLQFSAASSGSAPPAQTIRFTGSIPGLAFSLQNSSPWLKVSPQSGVSPRLIEVTADPAKLPPQTYTDTIVFTAPNAVPPVSRVSVTFSVGAAQAPKLAVDKESLSFPFPRNGKLRSQPVTVSNDRGGTLAFTANVQTQTGGNWLSVSPGAGQALPGAPVTLTVTADPSGLPPGTYSATLTIAGAGDTQTLPVIMTISAVNQAILLSQTGLSFLGVSQGGVVPPQTFGVINIGTGVVTYTVSKSTLSGNPDWLQVGTTGGSTDAAGSTVPTVSVSVNPSILPPGKYYGLVSVDAPGAANAPQVVTIFLQVLMPGSDVGAAVTPSEQLFATTAAAGSPGSQDLLLYNVSATPKSFRSSVSADAGLRLVTLPADGTLDPLRPTRIVVQPFTDGLAPGVYNGTVTLQFSDGRVGELKLSVAVASELTKSGGASRNVDAVCKPASLLQALTTLGQSFTVTAGYPIGLGVQVTDDCGTPLEAGSVSVNFSNGDQMVALQPLKGGRWEGTWNAQNQNAAQVTLTLRASDPQGLLRGERQIRGLAEATADPPAFDKRGVVSAASGQQFVPLAPGSIISIFGERLATDTKTFASTPLPQTLLDTTVIMAGRILPLYYVSPGQINAQVPFDLPVNTTHQIYVRKGITASQPILIDVAPAQPSLFGNSGQVIAQAYRGSAPPFLVSEQTPATKGDVLVLYSAGLGATTPAVPTGAVSPASPLPQTAAVATLTIGGQPAPVSFAGLTPGFVGLYQVNTQVPSGVPVGNAVPVVLSVAGQTGPAGTLAIR